MEELIKESLRGKKESYNTLKNLDLYSKEAQLLRKVFVAIVESIKEGDTVDYLTLAKRANELYPKDTHLPQRGILLARVLSPILQSICAISWKERGFMFCAVVVKKKNKKPGEGFFKLSESLKGKRATEEEVKDWQKKAKELLNILWKSKREL